MQAVVRPARLPDAFAAVQQRDSVAERDDRADSCLGDFIPEDETRS
ncbi:hypothetical protein OK348_01940 [Flavobacterium sp. MXW15]|uniref:Prevent-host-death protein n=1 Tax=Xanthomonas chitinilytica TaxID=2989819 RepID=A0ABT3JUA7_9XANT|nr:hypothetical protein [Xanthomonas sp. H13-6]MCW4453564.1 hypothetical protein [Flavobacterium sp. MXW15]MCW4472083.1 hypothetical protein [Xanthomonas sp. H13-6]